MRALRTDTTALAGDPAARCIAIDGDEPPASLLDGLRDEGLVPRSWHAIDASHPTDEAIDAVLLVARQGLPQRAAQLRLWQLRGGAPLVVLLSPLRELDHVLALEMGADDVLDAAWPASVVAARLRACWRRAPPAATASGPTELPDALVFGNLVIRHQDRSVAHGGRRVPLSDSEFDLLWVLASHAGRTLNRLEIAQALGHRASSDLAATPGRSIDSCIYRLRGKLGDHDVPEPRIRSVRHRGYLFLAAGW